MVLVYESSPGYYYLVVTENKKDNSKVKSENKKSIKKSEKSEKSENNKVKRISKKEYDSTIKKYNYSLDSIKIGYKVTIIVKPYNKGKHVSGKIKKILTKNKKHTKGHKVMLEDGTIGRMISVDK